MCPCHVPKQTLMKMNDANLDKRLCNLPNYHKPSFLGLFFRKKKIIGHFSKLMKRENVIYVLLSCHLHKEKGNLLLEKGRIFIMCAFHLQKVIFATLQNARLHT